MLQQATHICHQYRIAPNNVHAEVGRLGKPSRPPRRRLAIHLVSSDYSLQFHRENHTVHVPRIMPSSHAPVLPEKLAYLRTTPELPMCPSPSSLQPSMATTRNRKRRSKGDTTQAHSPEKSIRSTSTLKQASNFPPEFWDTISKVVLTSRALREIDRRHGNRSSATSAPPDSTVPTTLARFARHGGPDLRHLRAVWQLHPVPTECELIPG